MLLKIYYFIKLNSILNVSLLLDRLYKNSRGNVLLLLVILVILKSRKPNLFIKNIVLILIIKLLVKRLAALIINKLVNTIY